MIKSQLGTVMRKPSVRLKLLLITLLFIPTLIEQLNIIVSYVGRIGEKEQATVAVMILHTFNYLYFYVDVLLVGFIILIPDIVRDEYMEKQSVMLVGSRRRAAMAALARIICFSVLYVAWFVLLTIIISGFRLRAFSLEWPHFVSILQKQVPARALWYMQLVMLPENCMDYPVPIVVILVLLRSTLGLVFLGMLASLVTLVTKKTKFGVSVVIFLLAVTIFLYYDFDGGFLNYYDPAVPSLNALVIVDVIKASLTPFFTFRSMTDDFTYWICYGILCGLAVCVLTGAGIWIYYQKGDLDNADQDE